MKTENIFFLFFSIIALGYGLFVSLMMFLDRNKIAETKGKIISTELVLPELMAHRNAKLAVFRYTIDGEQYISTNKLKMPLSVEIGDVKIIKYYKENPNVLYTKTYMHFYLSLIFSIICLVLGLISY